jgi:quercetin dioxygenase-like cupin family protein
VSRALLTAVVLMSVGAAARAADANVPKAERGQDEGQRAAMAIERTLQRHGAEVHRCFEVALADRLDVAGKLDVEVEVGDGGKVTSAKAVSPTDEVGPELSGCLLASAASWEVDGIEPGAAVVLPFSFAGQANQFVVKAADVPDRGPGVGKKNPSGRRIEPPFTVKVLADPVNVRAEHVSLTLLNIGPASRVAMHRHPRSAKVLFLIKGKARVLGPKGMPPQKMDEGTAVFLPAGFPHVIENMGRQRRAVFLQAFAPPGPEKVYRDPHDPEGRVDFEVIRDPTRAKAPSPARGRVVARASGEVKTVPLPGGKGGARILFDEKNTGTPALSVALLDLERGAELARQEHPGTTELIYVLDGGGTLTVGSESHRFGSAEVLHIPADQPHTVKFGEKSAVIQIFAPAGPEQRARASAEPPGKQP